MIMVVEFVEVRRARCRYHRGRVRAVTGGVGDSALADLGTADLVWAANVIHHLPDPVASLRETNMFGAARNLRLLRDLHPVIAPGGGLAIVSYLRGRAPVAAAFGVQMLSWTPDGDAHGEDDYRDWLTASGYESVVLRDLDAPPQTMVLASRSGERPG